MTLAYFDCFSGISGDMTLGALVDAGMPIEHLRGELKKLHLSGYEISSEKVTRSGIAATKVRVHLDDVKQPARRLSDIKTIIECSGLTEPIKQKSIAIFERLAEVEAQVHGTTTDKVHFHEIGAVDALVDIVGAVIGLEYLGIAELHASPLNLGSGTVETAHGRLPVPAPATAELLKGIPLYSSSVTMELTTPTGAAIISTMASSFGQLPQLRINRIAYGAGNADIPDQPNVLRLFIGEPVTGDEQDSSVVIETNIDDMNPQMFEYIIEKLMQQGAHDVYLTPIIMKKGRPATLLSVLTDRANVDAIIDIIFRESTSIGVRIQQVGRRKLAREIVEMKTPYGIIRMKISKHGENVVTATPEYEDCKKLAKQKNVPLKSIVEETKRLFLAETQSSQRKSKTNDRKRNI